MEDKELHMPLAAYGCIIRGDESTSEDQVGLAISPEIAERMVYCWNEHDRLSASLASMTSQRDERALRVVTVIEKLKEQVDLKLEAERQRAQLLDSLKETLLALTHTVSNGRRYDAIKNAQALIAELEAGQ